jgi:hypothetical protein
MSELQLKEIADNADMIIANYSFTVTENGDVKILYLSNPDQACVLDKNGDMIMSTMDDVRNVVAVFGTRIFWRE